MFTKKSMDELERLSADDMRIAGKHPVIVILDDVRSMHNVGSTFRTCDAFAVEALYLCGYTPAPPHREENGTKHHDGRQCLAHDVQSNVFGFEETRQREPPLHAGHLLGRLRNEGRDLLYDRRRSGCVFERAVLMVRRP